MSFDLDLLCYQLESPSNGHITSCSSGTIKYGRGVGYEGDNCTYACNTGYILASGSSAVCLHNRTWNVTNHNEVCKLGTYTV